ncbi:Hypothetical predicted protein [Cloeon dipterum]|uniref:Uncharacterized protein n=1 Tax=Cloeon dipterum TaxID=197152 RepID=A0A8S1DHT3_9INSE|nr:Hypothetical predicted protein [Cloeon dipterum]
MTNCRVLPILVAVAASLLATQPSAVHAQFKSPLLQVWGVNLAGTHRLTPAEIWGVGLEKKQSVPFDPDEGVRLRSDFEATFGAGGQHLIDLLGSGKHVDDVVKDLRSAHQNRVFGRRQSSPFRQRPNRF